MSGHSKWANIKHRKERQDSQKSKKFQKLIGEIKKAFILNPNPETNSELKKLINLAKKENIPKEAIKRIFNKSLNSENQKTYWCELRFSKKINFIIKVITDNFIRSLNNIREVVKKSKIEILPANSIKHFFEILYKIIINKISEDILLECLENIEFKKIEEDENNIFLFFSDSIEIKKFKNIISFNKNIEIINSLEILEPFNKQKLSIEEKKEYLDIIKKLLNLSECKEIFDDLYYEK